VILWVNNREFHWQTSMATLRFETFKLLETIVAHSIANHELYFIAISSHLFLLIYIVQKKTLSSVTDERVYFPWKGQSAKLYKETVTTFCQRPTKQIKCVGKIPSFLGETNLTYCNRWAC